MGRSTTAERFLLHLEQHYNHVNQFLLRYWINSPRRKDFTPFRSIILKALATIPYFNFHFFSTLADIFAV